MGVYIFYHASLGIYVVAPASGFARDEFDAANTLACIECHAAESQQCGIKRWHS